MVYPSSFIRAYSGGSAVNNTSASTRDVGLIPGLGRSPGERTGNPLQWATVHGVAKSWTWFTADLTKNSLNLLVFNAALKVVWQVNFLFQSSFLWAQTGRETNIPWMFTSVWAVGYVYMIVFNPCRAVKWVFFFCFHFTVEETEAQKAK